MESNKSLVGGEWIDTHEWAGLCVRQVQGADECLAFGYENRVVQVFLPLADRLSFRDTPYDDYRSDEGFVNFAFRNRIPVPNSRVGELTTCSTGDFPALATELAKVRFDREARTWAPAGVSPRWINVLGEKDGVSHIFRRTLALNLSGTHQLLSPDKNECGGFTVLRLQEALGADAPGIERVVEALKGIRAARATHFEAMEAFIRASRASKILGPDFAK